MAAPLVLCFLPQVCCPVLRVGSSPAAGEHGITCWASLSSLHPQPKPALSPGRREVDVLIEDVLIERPIAQWVQGDALRLHFPLCCISPALESSFPVLSASCPAANTSRNLRRGFQPSPPSVIFLRCGYGVPLAWEQIYLV